MKLIPNPGKPLAVLFLLWFSVHLSGCGDSDSGKKQTVNEDSLKTVDIETPDENSIFGGPSPIQMALNIINAKAPFNSELPNPSTNADKYSSSFKQAINLGIYQADLGYIITNRQTQDALNYFESVNKLGDKLGIFGAFEEGMIDRAQNNLDSKDSLLDITQDAFKNADKYLNENQRPEVGDLIVVGGWLESTYLVTQTLKTFDSKMLRKRIGDDRLVLPKLIEMLKKHKEGSEYGELITKLEDINSIYKSFKVKTDYKEPEQDDSKKLVKLNSKTKVRYTPEQLNEITTKVEALRNSYTN